MFEKEKIDKGTPIPLYFQLKNIILKYINEGNLKPGDSIPTEMELAQIFDISRTTIRQAITELVMEGYLTRVKSKGTFVQRPPIRQEYIRSVRASHEHIRQQNMVPRTKILELHEDTADGEIPEELKIETGSPIVKMMRLRFANEEPILYTENYLSIFAKKILDVDMEKCGLFEFLDRDDKTRITKSVRTLSAVAANEEDAKLLNMKIGEPIQLSKSISYNQFGIPIEYAIVRFRGDRNIFTVELHI